MKHENPLEGAPSDQAAARSKLSVPQPGEIVGRLTDAEPETAETPNAWLAKFAADYRVSKKSLLVLAPDNDPFNVGTPGDLRDALWIVALMERHPTGCTHLRRLHYLAIDYDVPTPSGQKYCNTERWWKWLNSAAAAARNLGLVERSAIRDARSREWIWALLPEWITPSVEFNLPELETTLIDELSVSVAIEPPAIAGYHYDRDDDVRIAIVCEKSTVDDVLIPLAEWLGIDYLSAQGYISHTRAWEWLQRDTERPARLLFISDFDPAGNSMPQALARACEFMADYGSADVAIEQIGLTHRQVIELNLPTQPLEMDKVADTVRAKRQKFMDRFGVAGAVELDALVARHPGELERMITKAVQDLRDQTLQTRSIEARNEAAALVAEVWDEHQDDLDEAAELVNAPLREARERYEAELNEISSSEEMEQLRHLARNVSDELAALALPSRPEPERDDQEHDWLYRSDRDYMTQLAAYKAARIVSDLNG